MADPAPCRAAEDWSASQYLKFEDERTRPPRDLLAQVPLEAPGRVADLGCGAGFLANWLGDRGAEVIAVDHSEGMLDSAREHASPNVQFRRGEFDELPLRDGEVDAAFSNLVWHHLPDEGAAAREVFRAVRPGGAGS